MQNYQSRGAKILAARTMNAQTPQVFNYMVAAFDEPGRQRIELDFVKMMLGPTNAVVLVYGVRIADPRDYRGKAKEFLDRDSDTVGRALDQLASPDISRLPR